MTGLIFQNICIVTLCFLCPLVVNAQTTVLSSISQQPNDNSTPPPTTPGSTDIPIYDNIADEAATASGNCTIEYPEDAIEQFKVLLDKMEEAIFVYFKLSFDVEFDSDMAYLSDNTTDVIDPLTWVWSKGGRGELLLSSPFDFVHLSFGTLSPGVYSMDLDLTADAACFSSDTSDEDKMQAIATTLLDLTDKASAQLDKEPIACRDLEEEEDEDEVTSVCIEKQLGPDQFDVVGVYAFPSVSYTILQGSTVYECWTATTKTTPRSYPITTQSWLHWLLVGGIILALFSPLALDFFIRKHPPIIDRTKERFVLVTDPIPVGFKYVFFFWNENSPGFHFFRWVIIILLFGFLQYIPLLVAFCVDSDGLAKRMAAVYRVGLIDQATDIGLHVLINLVYFIFALVLLGVYVSTNGHKFLEPYLRERNAPKDREDEQQGDEGEVTDNGGGGDTNGNVDAENGGSPGDAAEGSARKDNNIAYKHFVVLTLDSQWQDLWTPDTILPDARAFLFIMEYRMKMMFDPNLWHFCVAWLWNNINTFCGAPSIEGDDDESGCNARAIICGLLFAIIFPFYLIFFIFLLCFNSLPLLYCLTRAFQTVSDEVRISEVAFFVGVLFVSVAWFCKFVGIFTFLAELLGYTFVGFVANAEIVGPFCLVVVVFIGYFVSTATDFYDVYCRLFREIVEAAEEVDGEFDKLAKDNPDSGMTEETLESAMYRKRLKPAKTLSWVKKGSKRVDEHIEMSEAQQQSAAPTSTSTPPSSLDGSNQTAQLLSNEDREVRRLVSKPGFGTIVTYNKKGTPAIESKLFWMIVEKYCPVRGKAGAALVQLLILAIIIAFGMTILAIVDGFRDLPATVELFGTVVVAGVIPIFLVAMRSPESQECYDEAMKRQLQVDVRYYALYGKLKSMAI